VFPAVRGKGELAVALFIYRQHAVQKSWTVVVTNIRLMTEMGIVRFTKYRAIKNLEDAGLVTVHHRNRKAVAVTILKRRRKPLKSARKV
jgi:predicted transcriptional regulator